MTICSVSSNVNLRVRSGNLSHWNIFFTSDLTWPVFALGGALRVSLSQLLPTLSTAGAFVALGGALQASLSRLLPTLFTAGASVSSTDSMSMTSAHSGH